MFLHDDFILICLFYVFSIADDFKDVIQPQAGPSLIKEEWNWIAPNGTSGGTVVGQPSPSLTSYLQQQQQQQQQQHLPPQQQQPPPLQPQPGGDINMDNISLPNLSDVNLSLLDNHLSENISGLNLL